MKRREIIKMFIDFFNEINIQSRQIFRTQVEYSIIRPFDGHDRLCMTRQNTIVILSLLKIQFTAIYDHKTTVYIILFNRLGVGDHRPGILLSKKKESQK
jgi:hypothetical protein